MKLQVEIDLSEWSEDWNGDMCNWVDEMVKKAITNKIKTSPVFKEFVDKKAGEAIEKIGR